MKSVLAGSLRERTSCPNEVSGIEIAQLGKPVLLESFKHVGFRRFPRYLGRSTCLGDYWTFVIGTCPYPVFKKLNNLENNLNNLKK